MSRTIKSIAFAKTANCFNSNLSIIFFNEMNESAAYIVSRVFMYTAFATPLISFFVVRKSEKRMVLKIINAVILTIILAGLFLMIGMWFFVKSGKVF